MTTITDGMTVLEPLLVLGYDTARESRNVIHKIIASATPVVTLRPAAPRKGTLALLFPNEAAADLAMRVHSRAAVFDLDEPDLPRSNMRYVLDGNVARSLDPESQLVWIVTVDYQEIAS